MREEFVSPSVTPWRKVFANLTEFEKTDNCYRTKTERKGFKF